MCAWVECAKKRVLSRRPPRLSRRLKLAEQSRNDAARLGALKRVILPGALLARYLKHGGLLVGGGVIASRPRCHRARQMAPMGRRLRCREMRETRGPVRCDGNGARFMCAGLLCAHSSGAICAAPRGMRFDSLKRDTRGQSDWVVSARRATERPRFPAPLVAWSMVATLAAKTRHSHE